jgi:hypothetical protein
MKIQRGAPAWEATAITPAISAYPIHAATPIKSGLPQPLRG